MTFARVATVVLALAAGLLAQTNPVPFLNQPANPLNAAPGSSGFNLTVYGAGFVSGSVLHWNGAPRPTTVISSSEIVAGISSEDVAEPSTATLTVQTPAPGGGLSNPVYFPITKPSDSLNYVVVTFAPEMSAGAPITADVNGDGNLDVVALNNLTGVLEVTLGNGDGTFESTVSNPIESSPTSVAVGDFDRDGRLDLAVANQNGSVSVLLGNGDGTFQQHQDYATGRQSSSVAVADFNRDGLLDLAVANDTTSGGVSILLGQGDGTFRAQVAYPAGPIPMAVVAGDFNRDGNVDLAVAFRSGAGVLLGNGDGSFQRAFLYFFSSVFIQSESLVAADFNKDGILDVAVGNEDEYVYYLPGKGDGTLKDFSWLVTLIPNSSIAAADINEDGNWDILTGDATVGGKSGFKYLLGGGKGRFKSFNGFNAHQTPVSVATGDFNNDGYVDVAVGDAVLLQTPTSH